MCVEGGEKEREREGGGVITTTSRSTKFRAMVANSLGIR